MITRGSGLWRFGQHLECRGQQVGVSTCTICGARLRRDWANRWVWEESD
jgi:hypothetical protein